jgi:carbamoyl-phosphate synthase large subunit
LADEGVSGKVLVADASSEAAAAYDADGWFLVPRISNQGFVDSLIELCANHGIGLLVPTIDTELAILSRHRDAFQACGTAVAVSAPATIDITGDKRATHSWLTQQGFPTPLQWETPFPDVAGISGHLPLILKPIEGSRSLGVLKISDVAGLEVAAAQAGAVLETLVDGVEYTVSTYVDRAGRCLAAVPRRRIEVRDGEVSKGVTERHEMAETLASSIVETLPGAWGPLNVQMIRETGSGRWVVIEMNARFGGGDPLAWEAGADSPRWLVRECLGRAVENTPWQPGLLMLRFDQAVYVGSDGRSVRVN